MGNFTSVPLEPKVCVDHGVLAVKVLMEGYSMLKDYALVFEYKM